MPAPKHKPRPGPEADAAEGHGQADAAHGHAHDHARDDELDVDEYLLLKVVEANEHHLKTMRWGLGLGFVLLLADPLLLAGAGLAAALAVNLVAGALLAIGLSGLSRQLELLRRAVAATDNFVFGDAGDEHGH